VNTSNLISAATAIQLIASIILSGIIAALTEGAAIPILIAAIGAFIDFLITASDVSDLVIADADYWEHLRCSIYCAITPTLDLDATQLTAIVAAIRADTYTSGSFDAPTWDNQLADYLAVMPIAQVR